MQPLPSQYCHLSQHQGKKLGEVESYWICAWLRGDGMVDEGH